MRTVPSRPSTQAQPAEGRPGPSDYDDDSDGDDDDSDDVDDDNVCDDDIGNYVCHLHLKIKIWLLSKFGKQLFADSTVHVLGVQ